MFISFGDTKLVLRDLVYFGRVYGMKKL